MASFASIVGPETCRRFSSLSVPINQVGELLSRDTVKVANELGMSIQELEFIKLTVSTKLLFTQVNTPQLSATESRTWKALPAALPGPGSEPSGVRPLGIPTLEALIGGGLPSGSISSFVGGAASGKTFICISCASACALLGLKVLLISASNDIAVKKLQIAMETIMRANQNPQKPYNTQQVQELLLFALTNIHVQHCYDVWALMDLLGKVKDHNNFDVIVVDSLHHFVAPLCLTQASTTLSRGTTVSGTVTTVGAVSATTASEFATSLLTQVGVLLRSIASTQTSVLLTNTPAAGLKRTNTIARTNSTSYNNTSTNTYSNTSNINSIDSGHGTSTALLDLVDITITLEKGEYDRSQSIRDLFNQSGAAVAAGGGAGGAAPMPTVIKAGMFRLLAVCCHKHFVSVSCCVTGRGAKNA